MSSNQTITNKLFTILYHESCVFIITTGRVPKYITAAGVRYGLIFNQTVNEPAQHKVIQIRRHQKATAYAMLQQSYWLTWHVCCKLESEKVDWGQKLGQNSWSLRCKIGHYGNMQSSSDLHRLLTGKSYYFGIWTSSSIYSWYIIIMHQMKI